MIKNCSLQAIDTEYYIGVLGTTGRNLYKKVQLLLAIIFLVTETVDF